MHMLLTSDYRGLQGGRKTGSWELVAWAFWLDCDLYLYVRYHETRLFCPINGALQPLPASLLGLGMEWVT